MGIVLSYRSTGIWVLLYSFVLSRNGGIGQKPLNLITHQPLVSFLHQLSLAQPSSTPRGLCTTTASQSFLSPAFISPLPLPLSSDPPHANRSSIALFSIVVITPIYETNNVPTITSYRSPDARKPKFGSRYRVTELLQKRKRDGSLQCITNHQKHTTIPPSFDSTQIPLALTILSFEDTLLFQDMGIKFSRYVGFLSLWR
jgi:hypothetical protein